MILFELILCRDKLQPIWLFNLIVIWFLFDFVEQVFFSIIARIVFCWSLSTLYRSCRLYSCRMIIQNVEIIERWLVLLVYLLFWVRVFDTGTALEWFIIRGHQCLQGKLFAGSAIAYWFDHFHFNLLAFICLAPILMCINLIFLSILRIDWIIRPYTMNLWWQLLRSSL
jgi:hypothetical protein